ncbi:hypothetical protein [Reyranella sp.]|jgi:hypothetical protein|uniref:hypothetical protein n=1 Tax=Reyranella sp. TaxID=1929291 RepID=UPI000BD07996|nr:hypothetical protein [Reyranella sp.]OYY46667.1 MAG: hypothetical protein B7Y57_00005 [Rhodospirillales bacterium 35-66-84]OYZ96687.1 MAG: hypothetical protein B7Y08_00365 [Rhodospirillales bacterium 24-66-33]OZB27986.1 MAG: hypothetical protein B7X63_04775 [Rhodospirillales bacterium 39-66-50]HQS18457.1 hypothetical protein [Reyranella sp.]HQT10050.1 hypothetical protein [Reyranella sp.]
MSEWITPVLAWLTYLLGWLEMRMFVPIAGSLAAAFFGAYTAQRIIERRETRQKQSKEIRSTSVAITLALHVANTFIAMKKQHIRRLHEDYHRSKKEIVNRLKTRPVATEERVFNFKADLEYLPLAELPTDHLQRIVADEISVVARPLLLPSIIRQVVRSQHDAVTARNRQIDEFKKVSLLGGDFTAGFFGLDHPRGVDNRYGANLDAISAYTDDCIYFSIRLTNDLLEHGRTLQKKYEARFKEKAPRITIADFSKVEKDLLPPVDNYPEWEKMSSGLDVGRTSPKPLWKRLMRRV